MLFRVEFTSSGRKDFKRLDDQVQDRISEVLALLTITPRPRGIEQLGKDTYRYRIGKFRIIYEVMDHILIVLVIRVQKRDEVYK